MRQLLDLPADDTAVVDALRAARDAEPIAPILGAQAPPYGIVVGVLRPLYACRPEK